MRAFTRGQLHYLLTNPVYIGRIRHKELTYPGLHAPIINQDLWHAVQERLLAAKARPRGRSANPTEARILTGKLRDDTGDILTPTHTQRHGRRFAYYVSHRLIAGGKDPTGWRLPAEALESTVRRLVAQHLQDMAMQHGVLAAPDAMEAAGLAQREMEFAQRVVIDPSLFATLIQAVTLGQGRIRMQLDAAATAKAFDVSVDALSPALLAFERPFALRRRGVETRIVAGETEPQPDPVLVRALARARVWARSLHTGTSLAEIAASIGHSEPFVRTRIALAFLAPSLQTAIVEGRQSPDLSLARILRDGIPMGWHEQMKRFGNA